MLDLIGETVRNVVIIVLLAAFIEMLLPGEEMGRYVRLVMGLFVIIALLQPVVGFLDGGQTFEVSAYSNIPAESGRDLSSIISRGEDLQRQGRKIALEEYRQRLARQIQAVVQLVPGVRRAEVEVEVEEDTGSLGAILQVTVMVELGEGSPDTRPPAGTVAPVKPVKIEVSDNQPQAGGTKPESTGETRENNHDPDRVKREVVATVSNFYNIRPEQVQVVVVTE
ncbi:hypothetical protein SY88_06935 [Clostridiales bacterium PH28_bin88]|nr:hypothetical protein SY88_06935 [Clostridiales bacterium PH28_bin88]